LIVDDIASALRKYPIDPGCFVVIVTRGHQHDHQALEAVIRRPARYIGLIGSKRKTRMIFKDLLASGVSQEHVDRVHSPIGLPIDAVTVPEIAVSIVAELVQVRRQDTPTLVEGPIEVGSI
jgi:xanthine dehydrogenase accessory factor